MRQSALSSNKSLSRAFGVLTSRRNNQVHLNSAILSTPPPVSNPPSGNADAISIRKIFDDELHWAEFNEQIKSGKMFSFGSTSSGLFLNPYLKSTKGLKDFASESLEKLKLLVEYMVTDNSEEASKNFIRNLDRLSDILCRVIDLLEFVRVVHPNRHFVDAAQDCHQLLFQYMNILNTSSDLHERLDRVLKDEKIRSELTAEELSVGELLLTDFLRSGINMDEKTKENFVELSQHISLIGQHFVNGVGSSDKNHILLDVDDMKDLDSSILNLLSQSSTTKAYKVPLYGRLPFEILRSSKNPKVRKEIWKNLHQSPPQQIELLDLFLKHRGVLAHLLGHDSFSEYQLEEKMAKNPQNVMSFLMNLLRKISSDVNLELRQLAKGDPALMDLSDDKLIDEIKPWDRDYLTSIYMTNKRRPLQNDQDISSYFSVGTVIEGLSNLFEKIYGIKLIPVKTESGEIWSTDVRKFNAVSETEGIVGIIYLDLFHRKNKTANPAHFTVCCSRKIYPEELHADDKFRLEQETIHTNSSKSGEMFQLPVISLVCDFQPDPITNITLLSLHQVETLFHEMGHAMHSMLGRTNLHNVSGTRCATDFVELPSILMEHFAKDPRVLSMIGKHYKTDEPLPKTLLENFQIDNNFLKNCEILGQIKMLLLDQLLHSNAVFDRQFDLIKIYHDLEEQLRVFKDVETTWPGKFGHLFSYGSVYYSYLFDRAIASKIWFHLFDENPLDRSNGEKFKNGILKWGGSKNPWGLLADVLDEPLLKKGDQKLMEIIGNVRDI